MPQRHRGTEAQRHGGLLKSLCVSQCCNVKENQEEINHEDREEKIGFDNKLLRDLRVLRGEKILIVQLSVSPCLCGKPTVVQKPLATLQSNVDNKLTLPHTACIN